MLSSVIPAHRVGDAHATATIGSGMYSMVSLLATSGRVTDSMAPPFAPPTTMQVVAFTHATATGRSINVAACDQLLPRLRDWSSSVAPLR